MQLSIIIVNYNVKHFLEQCLHSLRAAVAGISAEVLVVDNASTDGSLAYLQPLFPEVVWIDAGENLGFARANNLALGRARGAHLLFLNPDTLLPENCLHRCLHFMESHADAGALGVHMVDGSGRFLRESKRAFPSPLTSFFKLTGLAALFPHSPVFARYYLGHLPHHLSQQADVLAGAFMLIRRSVLEVCGSFDERFFMYAEDIDLSYRIQQTPLPQQAGFYRNYYFAGTSIIHFKGESTKKGSLNYVMLFYKAMGQFVQKHYSRGYAGLFKLMLYIAIAARAAATLTAGLIRRLGLPLLDVCVVSASLYAIWQLWVQWVRPDVQWIPSLLQFALPAFGILFLLSGALTGLYSRWYARRRAMGGMAFTLVVVLAVYSLFPESWRFSRGIILFGGMLAGAAMLALRSIAVKLGLLQVDNEGDKGRQTLVAGSPADYTRVLALMKANHLEHRLLGRLAIEKPALPDALMPLETWQQQPELLPATELICCPGAAFSMEQTMLLLQNKGSIACKFHYSGSQSMVGSYDSNMSGEAVSGMAAYRLANPSAAGSKRIFDCGTAIFLLISLPVQVLFIKNVRGLIANCVAVLQGKKTWVGYTRAQPLLPAIKPGVLGCNALPVQPYPALQHEASMALDERYALYYHYRHDISLVWKGYRHLGHRTQAV